METRKYRKVMLFFWGIINISIIICFIFDFFNTLFDGGNVFEIFSSSFVFKFSIRHSSNFYRYANGQFSLSEFEQFHRH